MGLFDTFKKINEDVHGERLMQGLQDTLKLFSTMSEQQKSNAFTEFLRLRSRVFSHIENMTPEGQIRMGRMIQDKARKIYDFQIDISCGTWMVGAWLESFGRIQKTKNDKADGVFLFLTHFFERDSSQSSFNSSDGAFWKIDGNGYCLYEEGKAINTETTSAWRGNDLLVYHSVSRKYYLLKDYKNSLDQLQPAKSIKSDNQTLWYTDGNSYWLYEAGIAINNETTSVWRENDLLVYHSASSRYFLLEDYKNRADSQLQPAKLIKSDDKFYTSS